MIIQPQWGPQTLAINSKATMVIFGGQAGGAKTYSLFLRFHYLAELYPGLQGVIFRRTTPELRGPGSMWEESQEVFRPLGYVPRESPQLGWRKGRTYLEFRHLQHEKTKYDHQGRQYGFVGMDEATHFTETQIRYLFGRLRKGPPHKDTGEPLEPTMMLPCNPDPDSPIKGWIEYWLDENNQYADYKKAGKKMWCIWRGETLVQKPTQEELHLTEHEHPFSMTFIPSKLSDNKILLRKDPTYKAKLQAQVSYERKRLEDGDWQARPQRGDYFQRGWFKEWAPTEFERRILRQPLARDLIRMVRAYDLAATPVEGCLVPGVPRPELFTAGKRDADWTRGVKLGLFKNGDMVVLDMVSCRDTPGAVDHLLIETAKDDGPTTVIGLPQDPGQAGVDQIMKKEDLLREYATVEGSLRSKSKEFYAKPASVFVYSGRMWYVRAPWNTVFFGELENFPPEAPATQVTGDKKVTMHDDIVDAFADAFNLIEGLHISYGYEKVDNLSARAIEQKQYSEFNDVRTTAGFGRRDLF